MNGPPVNSSLHNLQVNIIFMNMSFNREIIMHNTISHRGAVVVVIVWIFTITCAISALWVRTQFRRSVLDTTFYDKVWQWLATGQSFLPGTPVSPTNNTERHDIIEILLKVALNTLTPYPFYSCLFKKKLLSYILQHEK